MQRPGGWYPRCNCWAWEMPQAIETCTMTAGREDGLSSISVGLADRNKLSVSVARFRFPETSGGADDVPEAWALHRGRRAAFQGDQPLKAPMAAAPSLR